MEDTIAVILAAGDGKRMKSSHPKVLCEVALKPMLGWVIEACQKSGLNKICVVVGSRAEEVEKMKLRAKAGKAVLEHEISDLETQVQKAELELETVSGDRLKKLALEKQANKLRQELMKRQENQFFDAMRLDMELEEQIKAFTEKEKLTAKVTREFVVRVEGSL